MTIENAIRQFDETRQNDVSSYKKQLWLSELDMKISAEILSQRGGAEFLGYDETTLPETELLAPKEYEEIYTAYLAMKLDYMNGEIGRYNNSSAVFNRLYYEMMNFCNRREMVKKTNSIKAGKLYV